MERKVTIRVVDSRLLLLWLTSFILSCNLNKQENRLIGTVVDKNDIPIENVTILLKKKDSLSNIEHYVQGTVTDQNGDFEIRIAGDLDGFVLFLAKIGYYELFINDLNSATNKNKFELIKDTSEHVDFIPKN